MFLKIIIYMKIITFVLCMYYETNIFQLFIYWLDYIVLNISEKLHCHTDRIKNFRFPYKPWEQTL